MTQEQGKFKVAAVQAAPAFLDLEASLDKAIGLIAEAARNGAALVAFPETWIPGYPWWVWLGSPAWGMRFFKAYHDNSLAVGSPGFERLAAAAAQHRIHVVAGCSEREGGSLYLAQTLFGPDGKVLFHRRKLKPTHVERTVFGEGGGSDLVVQQTALGRIGALCCWEHLQPLTKYAMYSMQEQIHVGAWPSFSLYEGAAYALGPQVNTAASQLYAAEGQCFVVAPCGVVSQAMIDLLCDSDDKRALLKPGGGHARIYGPDGAPLAEPLAPDAEGLLYADVDLGLITYAKAAADPAGHYSRPDVTRLLLNRSPRRAVEIVGAQYEPAEPAGDDAQRPAAER